ncbi:MAG: serine protein kinase PrkA [Deltaproteobacteria bacterium]|nr:serine protein kinase PrkA [Deltaproteobacteria bacterium]
MTAAKNTLEAIAATTRATFDKRRTILSFDEYLDDVALHPRRHLRNAARYLMDVIQYFGVDDIKHAIGPVRRWRLFDQAFDEHRGRVAGQERVQAALVRVLENFVRSGRIDRLVLLHGPNGSAKTSLIQALTRAAEVYSQSDEGALYRFNWIFPTGAVQRGKVGFGGSSSSHAGSYARLEGTAVESRLPCELKDHPLFLLSREDRVGFLQDLVKPLQEREKDWMLPEILKTGDLSVKNRRIFDALLSTHHGDINEVLRHVQVERFYLSRRYRSGVVAVEPQLSVDAYSRQVTADRSLAMLPPALQHVALFETAGALNDANRGILEFNDLLKRPLDAWKYLLVATEQAQASLDQVSLFLDVVMVASSNELHLDAFKQHPDWPSFKGRMDLITAPYLLRVSDELSIYSDQVPRALTGLHVAPHALEVAARFAVLTRLEPPEPVHYPENVRDIVGSLTPVEKMSLYDDGSVPERFTQREKKDLRAIANKLYEEHVADDDYEGRHGASAREIRVVLLNAAQDRRFDHLSPIAVLDELRQLVKARSTYEFLRRDNVRGYRDVHAFVEDIEDLLQRQLEEEVRESIGLVKAGSHIELFERYLKHVSAWTKGEKLPDPLQPGRSVDPDPEVLRMVESVLSASGESAEDFRRGLIAQIGAYKLEHPDDAVDYELLFGNYMRRLKEDFYAQRSTAIERIETALLKLLDGEPSRDVDPRDREQAERLRVNMKARGYTDSSTRTVVAWLLKKRR